MFENTKALLDKFLEIGIPGYEIIVHKEGERVLHLMGGVSNLGKGTPIKGGETYYQYSCSKFVTSVAAMMLFERGLLDIDSPLDRYMPEFSEMTVGREENNRPANRKITVEDLFTMSAGFDYDTKADYVERFRRETDGKCPTALFGKYIAQKPLLFEPGEKFNYSFCHDVLAALVERISGERYSDFVKKNIFDPLGMTRSTFDPTSPLRSEVCQLYRYSEEEGKAIPTDEMIYILGDEYESGGAGLISNAEDLSLFVEGVRAYKLIRPETVDLMCRDLIADRRGGFWIPNYSYGLGVRVPMKNGAEMGIYDFGWSGAAGSYLSVDIRNGITVSYTQHLLSSPRVDLKRALVKTVTDDILDGR